MGQAFPHLLGLFLLMMLPLHGQLQVLTVEPDWSTFFTGESVKLMCDMREEKDADWYYAIRKDRQERYPFSTLKTHMVQLQTTNQGGQYACIGFNIQRATAKESNVVSLTVSDSAEWTVNRFSSSGYLTHCATWGSMTGPTCYINGWIFIDGVYWCETATGLFSNAVNITGSHNNAIVDFPVHPVTEGQPVTLRCKWTTELNLAVISFYKNDKLIQNDTRGEFFIPAVSKSDEGFYKCGRKGRMQRSAGSTSPASWMSIKAAVLSQQHPSSPVGIVSFMRIILVCVLTVAAGIAVCVLHRRPQQGERGELRQEPELCESGS
eukprot:XP_011617381.1 PREDICTED: uncharacterized protein LOC105418729 [Takifugu rubripes]